MRTAKILTASFLAAALAGCGTQDESKFFSCKNNDRSATVFVNGDTSRLSLEKEELVSLVPYMIGDDEVWSETAPRHEMEYHKSVASSYCQTGILPEPFAP